MEGRERSTRASSRRRLLANDHPAIERALLARRREQTRKVLGARLPVIAPGRAIGVLGGGQLGRMFAHAAQNLGYRVHIYEPSCPCPAGQVADCVTCAPYDDLAALEAFARRSTS